jgi:hypothetical protein
LRLCAEWNIRRRPSDAKWFIEVLNPEDLGIRGGYNVGIRLDRDSSDYLFGRLACTRFVGGIAAAKTAPIAPRETQNLFSVEMFIRMRAFAPDGTVLLVERVFALGYPAQT